MSKLIREGRRLRSNAALRNWIARIFPHSRVSEVPKISPSGLAYKGMKITVNGMSVEESEE